MPYEPSGNITTDERSVAVSTTWDTQTDWEAYQSASNVNISNGVVTLAETSAIPDSEDLHARYDFSDDSVTTSTVPDLTGNGYDLSGSFSEFGSINGVTSGAFDGVDDNVDVAFSSQSQPNHVFLVVEYIDYQNVTYPGFFDGYSPVTSVIQGNNSINGWGMNAGNSLQNDNVALDNNPHIISALFDLGSSVLRVDGNGVSGSAGQSGLDGVTLGSRGGGSNYSNIKIGEVLVYGSDKSNSVSEIETYLTDKWGITL